MIRTDFSGQSPITFRVGGELGSLLVPGSTVRVEILGTAPGGATLVRIAGRNFAALGIDQGRPGDSLTARVSVKDDIVFLHPLASPSNTGSADLVSRLGIGPNPASTFLVSFFQRIHARLDGKLIGQLARVASRFQEKEVRSAEAAALLSERGIDATEDSVRRCVDCIEGRDGFSGHSRDFLSFINHKKGSDRHWVILPFQRRLKNSDCHGSIRFLIDSAASVTLETRVTVFTGKQEWEFILHDGQCFFTAAPGFSSIAFDNFVVYLRGLLEKTGISAASWYRPGQNPCDTPQGIDLEI